MAAAAACGLSAQTLNYTAYTVATLAGNPNAGGGLADGSGSQALFASPQGVAVDGSGHVYVADTNNKAVRKVGSDGTTTTIATGSGPIHGIAVDASGNIFFGDWVTRDGAASSIRQISPSGVITTIATGLVQPQGLAVDSSGNLFVAESGRYTIDRIPAGGALAVYAGKAGTSGTADGPKGISTFGYPFGVAVDSSGNLFVTDEALDTIRKVSADGSISTLAGQPAQPQVNDGALASAGFSSPTGIAADGHGNLFVVDEGTVVREISGGSVSTLAGVPGVNGDRDGAGSNVTFNSAIGIAASASGTIYVADTGNSTIRSGSPMAHVAPVIQYQPANEQVYNGGTAILSVTASGSNPTYQWYFNGQAISGATSPTLTVNSATPLQSGPYTVAVTDAYGTTLSSAATVSVLTSARIVNLSTLAMVGTGANDLVAGFVTSGSGSKQLLLRGAGPALAGFGVPTPLAAPVLTLYSQGGATLGTNSGWGGDPAIAAAITATGAFAFPVNSADSALLVSLAPGLYSSHIDGAGNTTGNAIVELYDDDGAAPQSQLINISSRAVVSPTSPLTVGFVITGTTPMTLVIRGIGPTLANFGISSPVTATAITLYDSHRAVVASNTGWGGNAPLATAFGKVGAFSLPVLSKDSALLISLSPGLYTAQVSSADGSSGIGLVEAYEVQ